MDIGPDDLRSLLSENVVFGKLTDAHLQVLADIISEEREIAPGDYLIREGDEAKEIFIVSNGRLEVLKHEKGEHADQSHRLTVMLPGMSIGEVSLLDSGPRSASVRALDPARVLVLPIDAINRISSGDQPVDVQLKINLANQLGSRLRATNEAAVQTLREMLNEAETRAEMGRFMSRVLIGTCLYMFALSANKSLSGMVADTTMVTVPILITFAVALFINIKTSVFPLSAYGFTLKDWRPAISEAILFSLPLAALIVIVKLILIQIHPSMIGMPVFDFYQSKGVSTSTMIFSMAAYAIFAPVQEMVARSGMQSSFMMFLTSKRKVWLSIFLSTLLFSSTHLHVSFTLAILVFPLGMFWGWLYSRYPTLIGVAISHVALGVFGLFVIGFPTK
jgi:CRP-like cAMP-binding protein